MTCRQRPSLHLSLKAQSLSLAVVSVGLASSSTTAPAQATPLRANSGSSGISAIPAPPNNPDLAAQGVLTPGYPLANGHFLQGLKLKREGKKSQALVEFLQAVKENPRFTQALYEQALIFREKGFTKLALSALSQALKIDPGFKDARLLSATIKLELGDPLAAQSELSASLGLPSLSMTSSARSLAAPLTALPLSASSLGTRPGATAKNAGTITFSLTSGNAGQAQAQSVQTGHAKALTSATAKAAGKANDTTCVAPLPANILNNLTAARPESQKNRLTFTPEATSSKGSGITSNLEAYSNLKIEKRVEEAANEDEWVSKLRYLAKNGNASLKPGEAFMFSEDTGEAVLFLSNGQKIRRIIARPRDKQTIVKERRPDMLLPQDVMVKLSTLGKLVAQDPMKALEIATDTELQKMLASPPAAKKNQEAYGDFHDNNFLESPYLKESELERNSAKAIDARVNKTLDDSPFSDDHEGNRQSAISSSTTPFSDSSSSSSSTDSRSNSTSTSTSAKKGSRGELSSILDAEGKSNYLDEYKTSGSSANSSSAGSPEAKANAEKNQATSNASNDKAADPLKEFENELPADSFMEKTQRFFSWIRKSLNI